MQSRCFRNLKYLEESEMPSVKIFILKRTKSDPPPGKIVSDVRCAGEAR